MNTHELFKRAFDEAMDTEHRVRDFPHRIKNSKFFKEIVAELVGKRIVIFDANASKSIMVSEVNPPLVINPYFEIKNSVGERFEIGPEHIVAIQG